MTSVPALLALLTFIAAGAATAADGNAADAGSRPALRVETLGLERDGPPVVLIPGLACGGSVWDATAAALSEHHPVYVLTLAGFDGVPPIPPPRGERWSRAIADLITRQHLRRPVLVGHSFGVSVAVRAAAIEPASIGGLVLVDGKPVEPVPPDGQTPEQRRAQADANAAVMRLAAGPQWENLLRLYIRPMARDPRDADRVVEMCLRSDRETVIDATRQHAEDIRPLLDRLRHVPMTLILPLPPAPDAAAQAEASRRKAEQEFREAFRGAPHMQFRYVTDAAHMVMYDQPEQFHRLLLDEVRRMTAGRAGR